MYQRILVVLDDYGRSARLLGRVRLLIREFHCAVHLLIVQPPSHTATRRPARTASSAPQAAQAQHYLHDVSRQLQAEGSHVTTEVRCGEPVETILTTADAIEADLIAMTIPWLTSARWHKTIHTTEEVIRRALSPVIVERLGDYKLV